MNWNIIIRSFVSDLRPSALLKCDQVGSASNGSWLSGVGSFASGLFNTIGQVLGNAGAQDFTREMWNANNEYNSPKNQRKRLEDAGYNPYLLSMDSSASGQSVMPSNPPNHPLPGFQNPFHGSMELLQNGLQVESNIELQHAEAQQKIYDTIIKAYQEGGKDFGEQTMEELAPTLERLDFANSPLSRKLDAYIRGLELQNINTDLDNKFKDLENKWYDILSSDKHNLNEDTHMLNEDLHKQYKQVLLRIKAEIKEINSRTDLNKQQKENLAVEKVGLILSNGIRGLDFENQKTMQKDIQGIIHENLSNLQEDTGLKSAQNSYFYESGKTQKHNRKNSKVKAGPFVFEYQGYD